jgi:hypothetical protein
MSAHGRLQPARDAAKEWLPAATLRALFDAGIEYDQIAMLNEAVTNWQPNRSTVLLKRRAMGYDDRNTRRDDLLPWRVTVQDNAHRFWMMLAAESKRRAGEELSREDQSFVRSLDRLVGTDKVITYSPGSGWALANRLPSDEDIIRP